MQSYFHVRKEVRLNSTHYLIMKIHNKREFQNIVINHSVDIDYKDFLIFTENVHANHIFLLMILHYQLMIHYTLEKYF